MADFTQIIQEINDDINTNGVGAITGAKLNEVLRDMIAAVNAEKQDPLTIDATPTEDSTNPVQSGGVYDELEDKADKVSGATQGNLAGLDSYGNLTDSGIAASDVATNSDVVHNTGAETVAGRKTFSDGIVVALDNNIRFNTDSQGHGVDIFASEDLDDVKRLSLADMEHEEDCRLGGIATPDVSNDAANKEYVDGQVSAKYSKPSGGIPASDLTSAVQTSLGKADTAVQQVTVGTTTTGNAGTNASVTNSGTATDPVLNFTIPRGTDGANGQDGADAVNPFKGWWPDLATLKAAHTATAGDSAYVKDSSPATTWSIYVYDSTASSDNYWADSGTDADTSNVQTFASGEEVNQTNIDDDCREGKSTDVASAYVAKTLIDKADILLGAERVVTEYNIVNYFENTGFYKIENNAPVFSTSANWKYKIIPVEQLVATSAVAVGSNWQQIPGLSNIPPIIYLSSDTPSAQTMVGVQYGTRLISTVGAQTFWAIEQVSIPAGATHAIVNNSSVAGADATISIGVGENIKGVVTKLSELIVTVDSQGNGDYTNINDAIDNTYDGDTILIYPGVYEESVKMFGKNRHLVGICKDTCIITNGTGAYLTPPLEANIGSVENLTIIADNYAPTINDPSQDSSERGSYGIHIEYANATPYTLRISNCKILSKWSAGIGLGLRYNQTVKIENCELVSECVRMYSQYVNKWVEMGGIFFHNDASSGSSQGTGNLIIRDTIINGKKAAVTMEAVNTTPLAKALFVNTTCESEDYGVGNGIIYRFDNMETQEGYLCGNKIVLSQASHGNNIQDFNA